MTIYKITPRLLHGAVLVPSSKSMGHRMCICAGLSIPILKGELHSNFIGITGSR